MGKALHCHCLPEISRQNAPTQTMWLGLDYQCLTRHLFYSLWNSLKICFIDIKTYSSIVPTILWNVISHLAVFPGSKGPQMQALCTNFISQILCLDEAILWRFRVVLSIIVAGYAYPTSLFQGLFITHSLWSATRAPFQVVSPTRKEALLLYWYARKPA